MTKWLSFVYVIDNGKDKYKIGFSQSPSKRIKQIQLNSPDFLTLRNVIPILGYAAAVHEGLLHKRFTSKRVNREWFCLDNDDLNYIDEMDKEMTGAALICCHLMMEKLRIKREVNHATKKI